ncbi:type II secretion system protein [Candidatus Gottesmanbacteria bacterium]|nr:type II secretion system protein [Candidatus Gottesmanbacteria bacterium]
MKQRRGFTLVELMVVIAVIAILATIALFGLGKAQASARDSRRQQVMNGVRVALERYYGDNQAYPATGATAWAVISTLTGGSYLSAAPVDPCNGGTAIPATGVMAVCTPTAYVYAQGGSGTSYTLTLTKESGGTNTFVSPL